jgi:acyl-CoA thioesterase FadM
VKSNVKWGFMMRLRLRLIWLLISSFWRKPLNVLDESVLELRVLPNDVDVLKITNDRYLALMDLGRIDFVVRAGLVKAATRRKWVPLSTFVCIRFRYPLRMFEKYLLRTQIIYWDNDTFYFQQAFERNRRTLGTAYSCATLLGPNGPVSPDEILEILKFSGAKPKKPEIVSNLQAANDMIQKSQKEAESSNIQA